MPGGLEVVFVAENTYGGLIAECIPPGTLWLLSHLDSCFPANSLIFRFVVDHGSADNRKGRLDGNIWLWCVGVWPN